MLRLIGFLLILGAIGAGNYIYIGQMEARYAAKEKELRESLKRQQISTGKDSRRAIEDELIANYEGLKKQLEAQYKVKDKALEEKYGKFDAFEKQLLDKNEATAKALVQRETGIQRLTKELSDKEAQLGKQEKETNRKIADFKGMKLECKLFDLKKIEDYVKEFQRIAYATRRNVNLLCGLDPTSKHLVNRNGCVKGKEDREKARSLLSMIHSLANNVKQKQAFQDYVSSQRFRMQINP